MIDWWIGIVWIITFFIVMWGSRFLLGLGAIKLLKYAIKKDLVAPIKELKNKLDTKEKENMKALGTVAQFKTDYDLLADYATGLEKVRDDLTRFVLDVENIAKNEVASPNLNEAVKRIKEAVLSA